MVYIVIIIILLLLSYKYDIKGENGNKKFCSRVIVAIFILLAGMRYRLGVDTTRYLYKFYHDVPYLWELTEDNFYFGSDPLFMLLNSVVLSLGGRFFIVQFLQSAFVNILLYKYLKRHTSYVITSLFFYFIWQYYGYNMEEMRASMALVVCLFGNDYCIEKKWGKAILLYVIASLFHISAVVCIMTPLLLWLRFDFKGLIVCVLIFGLSIFIIPYIEGYMYLLEFSYAVSSKVNAYMDNEIHTESGLNILGYVTHIIMYLYPVISILKIKKEDKKNQLIKLEPFLMIAIIVAIINLRLPLVYRYLHFYAIYIILFVSNLSVSLIKGNARTHNLNQSLVGYILLFPLFFLMIKPNFDLNLYSRFIPYSSIIEKKVDRQRELTYSELDSYSASPNEY